MRARLALLVVPFLLVSLLPAAVTAASPPGAPTLPDAAAQHRAAVLAYWTPARMAAAIPRDFVIDGVRGLVPAKRPAPKPTPTPTPTPPSDPSDTIGASWTAGGLMLAATGRVYFVMGNQGWICSGSVITDHDTSQSIVLTAGHCVVDEKTGKFATDWMFIPAFDTHPTYTCADTAYGCWVADALYADQEFATARRFNTTAVQHDWGFAVVGGGGKTATDELQLDGAVESLGIEYGGKYSGEKMSAFGYPAAAPYGGSDLVYCRGTVGTDPGTGDTTWSLPCDMTGGSSGGPWVQAENTSTYAGAVVGSLNSYGYTGVTYMYGPMFNQETRDAFDSADSGTLLPGVVSSVP